MKSEAYLGEKNHRFGWAEFGICYQHLGSENRLILLMRRERRLSNLAEDWFFAGWEAKKFQKSPEKLENTPFLRKKWRKS